jgi:hypothetical protein
MVLQHCIECMLGNKSRGLKEMEWNFASPEDGNTL